MIQRKQTFFLAIAAVALLSSFVVPVDVAVAESWLPAIVPGISALVALGAVFAIFQYADRPRQRSVVMLLQYGALIVLAAIVVLRFVFRDAAAPLDVASWALSAAPAVLAYVFFLLARKGIEQDIALVRSMDRLR
ncbi:MAG: DUF4293 family protein [Rhodothermales bacterium]